MFFPKRYSKIKFCLLTEFNGNHKFTMPLSSMGNLVQAFKTHDYENEKK